MRNIPRMFDFPSENHTLQRNAVWRTRHNLTEIPSPYITEITNWFLLSQKTNIIPSTQTNNHISAIFYSFYTTGWENKRVAVVLKIPTRNCCLFVLVLVLPVKVYINHMGHRPQNTLTSIHSIALVLSSCWLLSRY